MIPVDPDRLVATASSLIDIHSFTGDEEAMARRMVELFEEHRNGRCSGSRSRTAARTRSARGVARAAARA